MKAICINSSGLSRQLTKDKSYDIIEKDRDGFITIVNDLGFPWSYDIPRFKFIDQIRNEKLTQLGI